MFIVLIFGILFTVVQGDGNITDSTLYRNFPLKCNNSGSTPFVTMKCMMGNSTDIPEVHRGAYYVYTDWQYAYYWDCLHHGYGENGLEKSLIDAISDEVDQMICSEHLMYGALPITHPDMSCVSATPSCDFVDVIDDECDAEEKKKPSHLNATKNEEQNQPLIPKVIYITHRYNLCDTKLSSAEVAKRAESVQYYRDLALNVQRIKDFNPEYDVQCYDDERAFAYLKSKDMDLARYFEAESHGMYKADLFRVVILFFEGGYYMDADLEPIVGLDVVVREDATFLSSTDYQRRNVFQAILAATKGNVILKENIKIFKQYYSKQLIFQEGKDPINFNLGTFLMRRALTQVTGETDLQSMREQKVYGEERIYLLEEQQHHAQGRNTWFYTWCVVDLETKQKIFWSRIVGYDHGG